MRLAEKLIPRSYHLLDYDWTPLSRNPCWLSSDVHHRRRYKTSIRSRPFCVWTSWTLKWAWWISISCVGSINLLETTYLDPGIVSSEISFCAAIHCGYTCYFFISSHLQPLKLFKCFFEECLIKFKKTCNKTPLPGPNEKTTKSAALRLCSPILSTLPSHCSTVVSYLCLHSTMAFNHCLHHCLDHCLHLS